MMNPQARRDNLLIEETLDELVVHDQVSHEVHRLNRTAALVWQHCDGQRSVADLARLLHEKLNLPASEDLVRLALDRLEKANLLLVTVKAPAESTISRRELFTYLMVAAYLTPVVYLIVAGCGEQMTTPTSTTDGGTPTPTDAGPTPTDAGPTTPRLTGTYPFTSCTVGRDPSGHNPFINLCGQVNSCNVSVVGSTCEITAPEPWVTCRGNRDPITGQIDLSGQGTVAGRSNVQVRCTGIVSNDAQLRCGYAMGVGGELPGGESIVYNIEARCSNCR